MNLKKVMQFNNPSTKIKNNMATPHLKKSIGRSPSRLALLLITILFACLGIRQSAQAGYTVTLQEVGPDVVATGSGTINLTGLTFRYSGSANPGLRPHVLGVLGLAVILTGPTSSSVDSYSGASGPTSFGGFPFFIPASSGSGDMVGIAVDYWGDVAFSLFQRAMSPVVLYRTARPTAAGLWTRRNTGHLRMGVGKRTEPELHASDPCTAAAASNWASGRHHQSRNLDRKLCSQTERLGQSARIDHQRVFSIWNNEQLRTHYRPAKSHREHLPKYQCAY